MPHSSLSTDYSFAANKFPPHLQSSIWKHAEIDLEESPPIRRAAVSSHIFHLLCEPELLFLRFQKTKYPKHPHNTPNLPDKESAVLSPYDRMQMPPEFFSVPQSSGGSESLFHHPADPHPTQW